MILIDDHLIAEQLASGRPRDEAAGGVATTCSWWWRLSSALAGSRRGVLSRLFADLDLTHRPAHRRTLASLPERLVILDIRDLVPAMAELAGEHGLNLLAAEALVAAELLGADLLVGQDTPRIREVAAVRGLRYRVAA